MISKRCMNDTACIMHLLDNIHEQPKRVMLATRIEAVNGGCDELSKEAGELRADWSNLPVSGLMSPICPPMVDGLRSGGWLYLWVRARVCVCVRV